MAFKDYLIQKQTAEESAKAKVLTDFKSDAAGMVGFVQSELPKIDKALHAVDKWLKENTGGVKPENLPRRVNDLLFQLQNFRNNPGVLRQALSEFDKLAVADLWGNRPSGELDINRVNIVRSSFVARLSLAHGTEGAIRGILKSLQAALKDWEEWQSWTSENPIEQAKESGSSKIMEPKKKADPNGVIATQSDFDPRV